MGPSAPLDELTLELFSVEPFAALDSLFDRLACKASLPEDVPELILLEVSHPAHMILWLQNQVLPQIRFL